MFLACAAASRWGAALMRIGSSRTHAAPLGLARRRVIADAQQDRPYQVGCARVTAMLALGLQPAPLLIASASWRD